MYPSSMAKASVLLLQTFWKRRGRDEQMIYNENLEKITVSIPYDLMVWVRENGSFSDMVRDILDRRTGDSSEFFVPEYKKPKRPHRGRPRKDEDPNYVPPVKRPRGRPPKSKEEKVLKEAKNEIG